MFRTLLAPLAVAAILTLSVAGCTKNAATGKRILTFGMSPDEEVNIGAQAMPEMIKEYGGKVENAALQQYVTNIGKNLAKQTESYNPTLPWEFTLLNTDVVNAFALPGGKVFFTRGLAEKLTSEAQMAGVLGHEIGHVTAQHGAQRISQQQIAAGVTAISAVVVESSSNQRVQQIGGDGVPALSFGGSLVLLKFGRGEELEADRLGVRYMSNVGYNPRGQLEVMQVLQSLSQGSSQPAILSTHPDPGARVEQIQGMLNGEYAQTQNNPKYQDFKERYKKEFLDVIKGVPKPPPPAKKTAAIPGLGDPSLWCAHCAAAAQAEESSPVPPREGVYAFFAPPAAK